MTLARILAASAKRRPNSIGFVDGPLRLSYQDWYNEILCIAGGLNRFGLRPGDHLVSVLSNRYETASLYWACQILNVIFTPFNWRATSDEINYIITDAEAELVVYENRSAKTVLEAVSATCFSTEKICYIDDIGSGFSFSTLQESDPYNGSLPKDNSAISLMLYTSGTTGRPKGVPRSHAAEIQATLGCIAQLHYKDSEISLGVMPLFHTMGIRSLLMSVFLNGTFVGMPTYNTGKALELIDNESISVLFLVPTMFHDIINYDKLDNFGLTSVNNIAYAGMSMNTTLALGCANLFPNALFSNFYGSSEIYTFSVRNNLATNPSSAGWAGIGQTLKIVRAAPEERVLPNEEMPIGEAGEIIASMSALDAFQGYWKRPDANAKAIRAEWYFTGDLGRLDKNGELYILGRVDDMIISGGENIYAEEVEGILAKSQDVLGVAVIGLPDIRWGEKVIAFIEPASKTVTPESLDIHCLNSTLARFKRPRGYGFIKNIPRSASGKLLRRHLRSGEYELLENYDNTV